jgi:hypothetical protein
MNRNWTYFISVFVFVVGTMAMAGCSKTNQQPTAAPVDHTVKQTANQPAATPVVAKNSPAKPEPPPKADEIKGRYAHLGISGSDFTAPKGYALDGEGGLVIYRFNDGEVWQADFEPGDYRPLDQRWIYFAHISGDSSKGCGTEIGKYASVPAHCLVEEKVLTFQGARRFLTPRVKHASDEIQSLTMFYERRDRERQKIYASIMAE